MSVINFHRSYPARIVIDIKFDLIKSTIGVLRRRIYFTFNDSNN
jgi:hypothetical protein